VIRQLLKDSRLTVARTKCRLSGRRFDAVTDMLRERLDLCHAALRDWRFRLST